MDLLIVLAGTVGLVVTVVLVHYETLLNASRLAERMTMSFSPFVTFAPAVNVTDVAVCAVIVPSTPPIAAL